MTTEILKKGGEARAAEILRAGGLVALPTETVYGLGADGLNPEAVRRIFEVKGRPQDNPLILHVADASALAQWCRDIPEEAYRLAERFWPGPLTMVLYRQKTVPLQVTAGLETVAMRCPDHPLTREVIRLAGVPIAAPSANRSGKPSTTTAEHCIHDLNGRIEAILDGGPCRVGVESTIVDLTVDPPQILRPGGITLRQLQEVLGRVDTDPGLVSADAVPKAPGMKYRHYSPEAEVRLVYSDDPERFYAYAAELPDEGTAVLCFRGEEDRFPGKRCLAYGASEQPETLAEGLFRCLRELDTPEIRLICAHCPEDTGVGSAVVNRLKKAAGGTVLCL